MCISSCLGRCPEQLTRLAYQRIEIECAAPHHAVGVLLVGSPGGGLPGGVHIPIVRAGFGALLAAETPEYLNVHRVCVHDCVEYMYVVSCFGGENPIILGNRAWLQCFRRGSHAEKHISGVYFAVGFTLPPSLVVIYACEYPHASLYARFCTCGCILGFVRAKHVFVHACFQQTF
jgi:hypothetical protein